jgi:hypothetical protein
VEFTIARSAGIERGKSNNGSIISRARVRMDIAAKNVPFTTSAQVPSAAIGKSCQAAPSTRNF